jgi:4-hydroxybenzoate polyprenyltransferase
LLLFPTFWGLICAGRGHIPLSLCLIFLIGSFAMRSAGCIINDLWDVSIDKHVQRTQMRPLPAGMCTYREAYYCLLAFLLIALSVLAFLPPLAWLWAAIAMILAIVYPTMKRVFACPQLLLALAFSMGIPIAYASMHRVAHLEAYLIFCANCLWTIAFDTQYALADREDDLKLGVHSSAILFMQHELGAIILLQAVFVGLLFGLGYIVNAHVLYYWLIAGNILLFAYQDWGMRHLEAKYCLKAFQHNRWVGLLTTIAIWSAYLCR